MDAPTLTRPVETLATARYRCDPCAVRLLLVGTELTVFAELHFLQERHYRC